MTIETRTIVLGSQDVTAYVVASSDGGYYPIGYTPEEAQAFINDQVSRCVDNVAEAQSSIDDIDAKLEIANEEDTKVLLNEKSRVEAVKSDREAALAEWSGATLP